MSKKLKTIDVKGKKYVEVHERLKYFRTNFKNHSLITEVVEKTDSSILIKAVITNEEGKVVATGLAEEVKGSSFINKTSYVENCETSAWGRALGNLGIGLDSAVASYEEVANAKLNSSPSKQAVHFNQVTTLPSIQVGDNYAVALEFIAKNKSKGLKWCGQELRKMYEINDEYTEAIAKNFKELA
tara:strand:- start:905 stop:1459 length:555 start_codon:yes stop_codon:yes gene_type:complete